MSRRKPSNGIKQSDTMKIILTEAELKEALIIWGVEKGIRLPDDIKVKIRRKSRTDETAGTIVIEVPESTDGTWSENPRIS